MKKLFLIVTAGLISLTSGAKDIKGTYNGTKMGKDGIAIILCKRSQYICVRIAKLEDDNGWNASVINPDGSTVFEQTCSGFYESETPEMDIEVSLLP